MEPIERFEKALDALVEAWNNGASDAFMEAYREGRISSALTRKMQRTVRNASEFKGESIRKRMRGNWF